MAEYEWCGRVTFDRIRVMCPNHPCRVRLAGRMSFSRVTYNRVNLAESEWSGRMTEYDWLAE